MDAEAYRLPCITWMLKSGGSLYGSLLIFPCRAETLRAIFGARSHPMQFNLDLNEKESGAASAVDVKVARSSPSIVRM